jgi:hypothetical protein
MAATTISRATLTDSTSPSTGDIVNATFINSNIYDKIDLLFAASMTLERSSSGDIAFTVSNASNTAGSDAQIAATVAGTTAGDPYATFTVTSGGVFSMGVDNSDSDTFKIANSATLGTTDVFGITTGGRVHIGSTFANTKMTVGLTINQGANDDEAFALKSSDVAHGVTDVTETDTFLSIKKTDAASGGGSIAALSEATAAMGLTAVGTTADTTKSTLGTGAFVVNGALKSGTGVASLGANANIIVFRDNGTTRFILDADGDSHQDVGTAWTNFDDYDDLDLLHALSAGISRTRDPLRQAFGGLLKKYRRTLEAAGIVTFNRNGHHFVNWSRFHMLMIGAVRQTGERVRALETRLAMLEA